MIKFKWVKPEIEVWKDIKGYEGLYQISDKGRIRSLDRYAMHKSGSTYKRKGRILSTSPRGKLGYIYINLRDENNKYSGKLVHVLLAIAFLNHEPEKTGLVVDHIDNVKSNNSLDNLQLITPRENLTKDKKISKSGFRGVTINDSNPNNIKYIARIRINSKQVVLGIFSTPEEAANAYNKKIKEIENGNE